MATQLQLERNLKENGKECKNYVEKQWSFKFGLKSIQSVSWKFRSKIRNLKTLLV